MADITMPQLGETVTEGTIIRWLKQVGESIAQDEPLFEVSTDKVDSEVPSPESGVLSEILVQEGETVDVGAKLAVVASADSAAAAPPAAEAPAAAPEPAPEPEPVAEAPQAPPAPAPEPAAAAPVEEAPPAAPAPVSASASYNPPEQPSNGNGSRSALLSPVVRKLVDENGIDVDTIAGTGIGGRITRDDVLKAIEGRQAASVAEAPSSPAPAASVEPAPTPAPSPAESVPAAESAPATQNAAPVQSAAPAAMSPTTSAPVGPRDEVVPFTTIRRLTAEHMVRSRDTAVHTLIALEADFENVDRIRRAERERFKAEEGTSLTYLPFIARAVVDVLRDFPNLNSSVGDDALILHRDIHLGFAVDLSLEGLIVPVVHNADGQSLRGLARSFADLASRARSRQLSATEIAGGTFTITNPGPFGTLISAPIIAQPQVAILSTDGVKRKPVVVTGPDGTEAISIHSVGVLALSFDHRAVDGAYAAAFLHQLGQVIETRDWASEL